MSTADHTADHSAAATAARATALAGGPLFLLGVILHPARDGHGIAAAGNLYGLTHDIQAIGLLLVAISLAAAHASAPKRYGTAGLPVFLTALAGHLLWLAVIAIDGARNPVMARLDPTIVHTHADFDPGVVAIALPAMLLFPLGSVLLGRLLAKNGAHWPGLLIAGGILIYTAGSIAVFIAGPHSPLVQILEVAGALPYAAGLALLGLQRGGTARK
ncbi:hypothetical protein SAMN05421505_11896 [Sinosporangium album]|uniref:DUF4386 family protein n=1 Tax=Sinosporangium album TaxID=504805 RepID=A0A1G8DLS0_9ACTN|nr:hypothetical protein [Sinosporangium album]SDH58521.1 hypothetical protein SAMN05421505_11896 [Sinosporangium album]